MPTLVTLTGRFTNPDGTPALAGGRITFTLVPGEVPDTSVPETVLAGPVSTAIVAGAFTVNLRATDDPELTANVDGPLIYKVTRTGMTGTWNILLPAPGPHDWTALSPQPGESNTVVVPGVGIPTGGDTGDVLTKTSGTDYDVDWVDPGELAMSALTVDTDELYRVILFSNGNTRAIPFAATEPATPTGFARTVRVNSVKLTWTAVAGASTYEINRNGSLYATTSTNSYRDSSVVLSSTYTYAVRAVSTYGLRSDYTTPPLSAFIDPTLNIAPTCEIRAWPATVAVGNRAIIRVNSIDADAQVLATLFAVDVGTLIATADPTVWILEPA